MSSPLDAADVQHIAQKNLGLLPARAGSERTLPINAPEVAAEALRAALWALTLDGQEQVYVTRLMGAARRLAQPALPAALRHNLEGIEKLMREAHDEATTLGDVALLPSGYRLPAPLRCVPLPDVGRWMLVGGLPSHKLPIDAREALEHAGAARFLTRPPTVLALSLREQSAASWCAQPTNDLNSLKSWTQHTLHDAALRPMDTLEAEFDAYAPGLRQNRDAQHLQYFRWTIQWHTLPDGRYLMRRRSTFGAVDARIGQIERGRLIATGPLHFPAETVGSGDTRRLCYGLDALAGCTVGVLKKTTREGVLFRLRNEIPGPEQRLFLALGQLRPPQDTEKYYPRDWLLPPSHAPLIEAALRGLGIELEARSF